MVRRAYRILGILALIAKTTLFQEGCVQQVFQTKHPEGPERLQAVLSVVPRVDDSRHAPLQLVAVLDRSGSTRGEKIRLMKQTMVFMLSYLSDHWAEYGSDVPVVTPLTLCVIQP